MNTCLSIQQKQSRRDERELGDEVPYISEPPGGDADPEAVTLNAERREELQDALQHVRADHRAALVLRHMEGLSYAEIAEVLQVPNGTAKGWVSRGRAAMLVVLEKDGLHRKEGGRGMTPVGGRSAGSAGEDRGLRGGRAEGEEVREAEQLIFDRPNGASPSPTPGCSSCSPLCSEEVEAPEVLVGYAIRRAYMSAFLRQAETFLGALGRSYLDALVYYFGLRAVRRESYGGGI